MRRQFEIYQLGLAGKKLSVPIPLAQLEKKAAEVLTPPAYDYVAGGASGERTMRQSRCLRSLAHRSAHATRRVRARSLR